jgi:hypothetical protein
MLSAGLAIGCKQTAVFEGLFLGCVVLWQLRRAGLTMPRIAATALPLALMGAAPMLAFALGYAAIGHFAEFWHALVTSNLAKSANPGSDALERIRALAIIASPLILPAMAGLAMNARGAEQAIPRPLVGGWLLASVAGVAIIPNFIDHYMLPLLLPLAVAAAPALGWRLAGPAYAAMAMVFAFLVGPSSKIEKHRQSRAAMESIAAGIHAREAQPRLLVYAGPAYLYAMVGTYSPSPLLLPTHLHYGVERDTSHLRTADEMRRILAWQPSVVVTSREDWGPYTNHETYGLMRAYLKQCRHWFTKPVIDYYSRYDLEIYGDCRKQQ